MHSVFFVFLSRYKPPLCTLRLYLLNVFKKKISIDSLKVRQSRNDFFKPTFPPQNEQMNSTLLPWNLVSTCFCSFFGRNWRHQKDINYLTFRPGKSLSFQYCWNHEKWCRFTKYLKIINPLDQTLWVKYGWQMLLLDDTNWHKNDKNIIPSILGTQR